MSSRVVLFFIGLGLAALGVLCGAISTVMDNLAPEDEGVGFGAAFVGVFGHVFVSSFSVIDGP